MPQENSRRKVKSHQQMIQALELRAAGASFRQIGEALSVSKPRAFRIVRKALDELVEHCQDTAERVRQLELYRMDRIRLCLDPKKGDPRVADTLIRISERVAKLHGLDAPQRIEASGPNGGPIQPRNRSRTMTDCRLMSCYFSKRWKRSPVALRTGTRASGGQSNPGRCSLARGLHFSRPCCKGSDRPSAFAVGASLQGSGPRHTGLFPQSFLVIQRSALFTIESRFW
jgi:hypothetical protein